MVIDGSLANEFEASKLQCGSRTPYFYGLPKIHKKFDRFPPLRPICSGFNSCTSKLSEFVDASLYPNIDHQEGIDAFENALTIRTSQSVPTSVLCDLIMTILKCNTLKFGERFFHQIKGTAMGTPMAVNLAELFMGKFETDSLNDYRNKYNK